MKKQYIAAFGCILAASCSKAELNEVNHGLYGEKITVTVPAQTVIVPAPTKAAISGNTYAFEGDEQIIAVASNGSKATLANSAGSLDSFTGTFDKPVTDGSTISFYYNTESIAEDGTASFTQNGKPWLLSMQNQFGRNDNNEIVVSATLAAPKNVRAVAVITTGSGIESLEFHAKDSGVKLGSFNGTAFDGESSVSQAVLSHGKLGNSNIFYVPTDLKGGFWIKAGKGELSMYKSYASSETISANKRVEISKFEPASVTFDIDISGFATSYSYYAANEGIEGISTNDVNTANSKSNDWMGEGKATVAVYPNGISSTLLKFESFKLTVDGKDYADEDSDGTITAAESTGHTTWGQKDIVATVVYKDIDGKEYTDTKTVTRHITGLPYNVDFKTKPSDWVRGNNVSWNDKGLKIGGGTALATQTTAKISFKIPSITDVLMVINHGTEMSQKWAFDVRSVFYTKIGNNAEATTFTCPTRQSGTVTQEAASIQSSLTSDGDTIQLRVENNAGGCTTDIYAIVPGLSISYR